VSVSELGGAGRRSPLLAVDVVGALNVVGTLLMYLSLAVLLPAGFAIGYGEPVWPFLASGAITGGVAALVTYATRGDHRLGVREGFLVVALTWLAAAAFGALPYILSGDPQVDRPVDAFFEGMSGFSTTGGSVIAHVEALPRSLAIWRQFTQWLGGIGIIVLALAVLPRLRVGGRQLLEHEMPGPEIETLSTRIRDTARRVWVLYIGLGFLIDRPGSDRPAEWVVLLFLVVFMTPLQAAGEEYFFRGWILQNVGSWFKRPMLSLIVGTAVSATAFSAAHGSPDPWILGSLAVFAISCCLLTWRTGGLEAAIAIHAVNNIAAFATVLNFGGWEEAFIGGDTKGDPLQFALDAAVQVIAFALIWWQAKRVGLDPWFRPTGTTGVS